MLYLKRDFKGTDICTQCLLTIHRRKNKNLQDVYFEGYSFLFKNNFLKGIKYYMEFLKGREGEVDGGGIM